MNIPCRARTSSATAPPTESVDSLGSRSRRGATLSELTVMLVVVGVILALAVPGGRGLLDRIAVTTAREEIVGLVHRARAVAAASGGATLRVDLQSESISLTAADGSMHDRLLLADRGIDLSTSGSSDAVTMTWNALGWGVVASRTLVLSRGSREARVVVSSRGRVTRR